MDFTYLTYEILKLVVWKFLKIFLKKSFLNLKLQFQFCIDILQHYFYFVKHFRSTKNFKKCNKGTNINFFDLLILFVFLELTS